MKKSTKIVKPSWSRILGMYLLGVVAGGLMLVALMRVVWHGKFYPGVRVANVEVGGLTRQEAKKKIVDASNNFLGELVFGGGRWTIPKETIVFDVETSLNNAYSYGRRARVEDYLLLMYNKLPDYPLVLAEGNSKQYENLLQEVAQVLEIPPIDPQVSIINGEIEIENGSDGTLIDSEALDKRIGESYSRLDGSPIEIPVKNVARQLGDTELNKLRARAEKLVDAKLILTLDDERVVLKGDQLLSFLNVRDGEEIDEEKLKIYLEEISLVLNRDPQDARFEFSEGKVKEFAPGRDGVEIKILDARFQILEAITTLLETEEKSKAIEIAAERTPPKVTTEKVNELGIRERIGRGESYYAHSIPNRIYNVGLASTRLNSALIGPGEEVSFNKLVGEVSGATGYRPAYIISGGRTILGDGGGLCQVSTTMFRAAMSAGLPILERWAHAYRVSYYELNSKPGVDAMVIAPSKDFRFLNDTPGHILIQTINDPKKLFLVIEIYGTSDGRVAAISEPKVWGITPPLPTIYQDDPSLPVGTMRQVDWSAPGARASFEYKVVRNGETIQDKTFTSNYKPWANVYLRGTGSPSAQ